MTMASKVELDHLTWCTLALVSPPFTLSGTKERLEFHTCACSILCHFLKSVAIHASNFSLCHDSLNPCFSSRADFEASLIRALRALFCSPEGVPVAVLRFWMLLSVKLLTNLDPQVFPKISIKFQVNPSHTKEY